MMNARHYVPSHIDRMTMTYIPFLKVERRQRLTVWIPKIKEQPPLVAAQLLCSIDPSPFSDSNVLFIGNKSIHGLIGHLEFVGSNGRHLSTPPP